MTSLSLDLGVLSGLSLCLHEYLGSALLKNNIFMSSRKDISGDE